MPPHQGRNRFHYAWVVLIAGMVVSTVSAGVRQSFGVFIDPLVEEHGWSRGAISFAYSSVFLASVPLSLVAGPLADRFGTRRLILGAGVSFIAGMLLTGTISSLWQFYLYYGLFLGGTGSTIFNLTLPVLLTRWFYKRMGLAVGLMWTAVGVGPVFVPPIFRWLIQTYGWRDAFFTVGLLGGGIILLAALFLRSRPEDIGGRAYGELETLSSADAAVPITPTVNFQAIRSSGAFRNLCLIHLLGCAAHSIPMAHMVSMATSVGVPSLTAAGLLSASSGASILSRFGTPQLTERLGGRRVLSFTFFLQTTPILLLLWSRDAVGFYTFALLFGLGFGGEMTGFPVINRQYYGSHAPLHSIYGYQLASAWIGMALGGYLGGFLFDLTGGYTWAILAALFFGYISLVPIRALPKHRREEGFLLASQHADPWGNSAHPHQ